MVGISGLNRLKTKTVGFNKESSQNRIAASKINLSVMDY